MSNFAIYGNVSHYENAHVLSLTISISELIVPDKILKIHDKLKFELDNML